MPTFDVNIITWKSFRNQFCVSIHSMSKLSNAEKLAILKHLLKDGSARHVVEGLSGSGVHCEEVADHLQIHFD